jgi:hypothetical protein
MTGIISALLEGKPIPVAVVADQQQLDQLDGAEDNGEVEVNTQTGPLRNRQRMLLDMLKGGNEED